MKIAALLPHVETFGGVRRYIEIGNELSKRGHYFVLFHPEGNKPEWLEFKGRTESFSSLEKESFNVALCSEYSILPYYEKLKARTKFFYFLLEGHKKEKEVARKNYFFLGNSKGICQRIKKKYNRPCFNAAGGVNTQIFYPLKKEARKNEFRVLCYGRLYKRRKGIQFVIQAVEKLYKKYPHLKLLLFDSLVGKERRDPRKLVKTHVPYEFYLNLPQKKMAWLYSQADIFVSAERRAGWSNTAAEAMACRVPVVCTKSGTRDFAFHNRTALVTAFPYPLFLGHQIKRLIQDKELGYRLAQEGYKRIITFTWSNLVDRLEETFEKVVKLK